MFWRRKKKKDLGEQQKLDFSDRKEKRKKKKDEGSAWGSTVMLFVLVLAGVVFWVYGVISRDEQLELDMSGWFEKSGEGDRGGVKKNDKSGVIIFEE